MGFAVTQERYEGFDQICMSGAGHEVKILPEAGFNVWYWHYNEEEILMKPVDIHIIGTKYGIPILFPTPNRIKNGTFQWKGKKYDMIKRGERVVIHGLVKDEPFTVSQCKAEEEYALCEGTISICPGNALFDAYPFPCTLTVRYTLTAEGLFMDMQVVNEGQEEMPFGFAVHPYFSKHGNADKVYMDVPVKRVYEADEALIPNGKIVEMDPEKRPNGFKSVESLYLDNVFRGMTEDAESQVRWENFTLHLSASDCYRNVVVYTPHDRPGFCIEPQTCSTNSINLYNEGLLDESGLLILPAGAKFESRVSYKVTKNEE